MLYLNLVKLFTFPFWYISTQSHFYIKRKALKSTRINKLLFYLVFLIARLHSQNFPFLILFIYVKINSKGVYALKYFKSQMDNTSLNKKIIINCYNI